MGTDSRQLRGPIRTLLRCVKIVLSTVYAQGSAEALLSLRDSRICMEMRSQTLLSTYHVKLGAVLFRGRTCALWW
jgi:hypothetical protein